MYDFKLIAVGALKDKALAARCDEFAKWISPYARFEKVELPDSGKEKENAALVRALEKERLAAACWVLSEEGREMTSVEFARALGAVQGKILFVIGGPDGLLPAVKTHATTLFSLSRLTFTHEMARFLLMEQLFRAVSILRGSGYHRV